MIQLISRYLVDRAFCSDKSIHEFPGAVHQLLLERPQIRSEARERTVQWITERIQQKMIRVEDIKKEK